MLARLLRVSARKIIHNGARGYSKVYVISSCASLLSSYFAGSNPAVCESISPVVWKLCPSGQPKRTVHELVCERTFFCSGIRYHSAKGEELRQISRSNAKRALPENGYRVIRDSAKRFLSALCRRHSNFQPLFLHE